MDPIDIAIGSLLSWLAILVTKKTWLTKTRRWILILLACVWITMLVAKLTFSH